MADQLDPAFKTDSTRLAELLAVESDTNELSDTDLQDALEHLLDTPIRLALNQLPFEIGTKLKRSALESGAGTWAGQAAVDTFADLLRHPEPPLELLRLMQDFGKAVQTHGKTVWPPEVGAVLYYASQSSDLVRHRERMSTLSGEDFLKGLGKILSWGWVPAGLKELLEAAKKEMLLSRPRRRS